MAAFQKIIEILFRHGVDFVLIGGLAAVAQGSAYVTADLDICYARSPENIEKLVKALSSLHPRLRGVKESVPFQWDSKTLKQGLNFTLVTDLGDVDLIGEVMGLGNYAKVEQASEILEMYEFKMNVLTLDGLIQSKEATGRGKDLQHVKELRALKKMKV